LLLTNTSVDRALWTVGFPLIRYNTGDLARAATAPCPCGRPYACLSRIVCWITDIPIRADGTAVSGLVLPQLLKDFPPIERFQAIQDRTGPIVLRVVASDGLPTEDRSRILEILGRLVPRVATSPEEVTDIPVPRQGNTAPSSPRACPRTFPEKPERRFNRFDSFGTGHEPIAGHAADGSS